LGATEPRELARRAPAALEGCRRSFNARAILEHKYDLAEERCHRDSWPR
jgi:hypothetical protein